MEPLPPARTVQLELFGHLLDPVIAEMGQIPLFGAEVPQEPSQEPTTI